MAGIILPNIDITQEPTPPAGKILLASDLSGTISIMDSTGTVSTVGSGTTTYLLTSGDDGWVLPTTSNAGIFVTVSSYSFMTIDISTGAQGQQVMILKTDNSMENELHVNGTFWDGGSLYLYGPGCYSLISDGSYWYIIMSEKI